MGYTHHARTKPTRGMIEEARQGGELREHPLTAATFPRIQLVTITDLLAGKRAEDAGARSSRISRPSPGPKDQMALEV